MVEWLRLGPANTGDVDSVPGWETNIPHAGQHSQEGKDCLKSNKNATVMHVQKHFNIYIYMCIRISAKLVIS